MAVAALLAGGAVALTGGVAGASGLVITPTFTTSSNAANVTTPTAPNTAVYTWSFKTSGTSVVAHSIKFSLPTGVTATGTIAVTPYGLPTGGTCGSSTTTVTSTAIKLTFASTYCTIPAGTSIEVTMTGPGKYKNGGISTYKAKVTVYNGTATTSGTAATVTPFVSNVTKVKVTVPESLTFTNSNSTILLMPVPGTPTVLTATAVVLKVATNAHKGYRLAACMVNLKTTTTTPNATIANPGPTPPSPFTGFAAKPTYSGSAGKGATWTAGTYSGYATTCTAAPVTGHTVLMKSTGPTPTAGANQVSVTNGVKVPSNQAAGVYTGTIVYQVTPKFT
jgi:hypothetical protein